MATGLEAIVRNLTGFCSFADKIVIAIGAGGVFGEMALIESGVRSAKAVARTDCALVPIDERRFSFLFQQTPQFALQVMKIMAERLRRRARSA